MKKIGFSGMVTISKILRPFRPMIFLVIAVILALAAPANTAAANEQHVSRVGRMALAVARGNDSVAQKVSELRDILSRFSDIRSIALFSLGRYRRKLPSDKALLYIDLMENFVAKFMVGFSDHFAGKSIKILRSKKRSKTDTVVESQIIYAGGVEPAQVKWRVITNSGQPKIFDVQVRGVWLTLRLRSQFTTVLKENNGNFDSLFSYMRK